MKIASTPMETSKPLLKDVEAEDVDVHLYRSMIGSFMYLTASRPDIMFVVCSCARFQVTPKVLHLHALKRIFRYLKAQPKLGLCQDKYVDEILKKFGFLTVKTASTPMETSKSLLKDAEVEYVDVHLYRSMIGPLMYLTASRPDIMFDVSYSDSDYAGASLDRKSTKGDEIVIKEGEDRMERAATTTSSLEAEQDSEAQIRFEAASKQSNDPPLSRVNTLGSRQHETKGIDGILTGKNGSRRKQRKDSGPTEPITDEATNEEHVSTPSYNPSQSGKDRMQLNELMDLCAKLSDRVLALENTNTSQVVKIATLKERVKKLEKKRKSRTYKPRRLYKVGLSRRIESSDDASLGAQEDASKQGRKIVDLDADTEVTLIDETQGRNDEDLMFDTGVLNGDDVFQEPIVNTDTTTKSSIPDSAADPVTTTGEVVTTASVEILEQLTLAQTLIEIKSAKPKAVTTAATIVTPASSIPVSVADPVTTTGEVVTTAGVEIPEELTLAHTLIEIKSVKPKAVTTAATTAKDKGNAKMVKLEKPLKKKDRIAIDEEVARNLEAQLQAQNEEEANMALIESWDNTQAMIDADFQLAQQMQTE
ncbi:hypothetical protein Tco_0524576 [Tanacetum coccineum]